jgi:TPR repeat protein
MSDDTDDVVEEFDEASKGFDEANAAFTCKGSDNNADDAQLVDQAITYMLKEDFEKSASLFQKAAEHGHMGAQYGLGEFYADYGKGVEHNEKKAAYWYTKAAKQGHPDAQNNLGTLFYKGVAVAENPTKAKYWHSRAAKQGNEIAKRNLGKLNYYDPKLLVMSIFGGILCGIIFASLFGFLGFIGGAIAGCVIMRLIRQH